jgi:hypothetical protein
MVLFGTAFLPLGSPASAGLFWRPVPSENPSGLQTSFAILDDSAHSPDPWMRSPHSGRCSATRPCPLSCSSFMMFPRPPPRVFVDDEDDRDRRGCRLGREHRGRGFIRKYVAPILIFSVPKGCSTVSRRCRMACGFLSRRFCTAFGHRRNQLRAARQKLAWRRPIVSIWVAKTLSLRNLLFSASAIQNSRILLSVSRCTGSSVILIARSQSAAFSHGST